jgi:hypothetical protein
VSEQKSRVMYLDVDDTLLVWTNDFVGFAAPRAAEFMYWALEHFEVRWLTMWCPSGRLQPHGAEELSYRFNYKVSQETFFNIYNPKMFWQDKTDGVDFEDPRPWVWVEDGLIRVEEDLLKRRNLWNNFYKTNVTHDRRMLQKTWRLLAERFNLPGGPVSPTPDTPYSIEMDMPLLVMTNADIMNKFRPPTNKAWVV